MKIIYNHRTCITFLYVDQIRLWSCCALCRSCEIPEILFKIAFWLGYCNSMINPIIYACSSKEFKNAYCRIIKCRCRQRRRHLGKWRQGSMNTPFCELKGSYHGSRQNAILNKISGISQLRHKAPEIENKGYCYIINIFIWWTPVVALYYNLHIFRFC
jgi:hypothetical protein